MADYPSISTSIPGIAVTKEYFRWADYIELLCLSIDDNEISARDVEDIIKQGKDLAPDEEDAEEGVTPKQDKWEQRVRDYFRVLNYRCEGAMSEFYPFQLVQDNLLNLKPNLTDKHYFYLYLLFSSNLAYFKQYEPLFTTTFEEISKEVVKKILPDNSEVHIFGTSRAGNRYTGDLYARICQLGRDIRAEVICKPDNFAGAHGGDGGLDIVGWIPIPDGAPGIPVCFSQCACTAEKWVDKQSSISHEIWRTRYRSFSPYLPAIIVPFSFRRANGLWENDDKIHQALLIDRDRIIMLLNDDIGFFNGTDAYQATLDLSRLRIDI
jgi:hypothetical protein